MNNSDTPDWIDELIQGAGQHAPVPRPMIDPNSPLGRGLDALDRLRSPGMSPRASAAWEEVHAALVEITARHQTAKDAAQLADALCDAHDEWESARVSGDAAMIEERAAAVIGSKAALQGVLAFMREAGELE